MASKGSWRLCNLLPLAHAIISYWHIYGCLLAARKAENHSGHLFAHRLLLHLIKHDRSHWPFDHPRKRIDSIVWLFDWKYMFIRLVIIVNNGQISMNINENRGYAYILILPLIIILQYKKKDTLTFCYYSKRKSILSLLFFISRSLTASHMVDLFFPSAIQPNGHVIWHFEVDSRLEVSSSSLMWHRPYLKIGDEHMARTD